VARFIRTGFDAHKIATIFYPSETVPAVSECRKLLLFAFWKNDVATIRLVFTIPYLICTEKKLNICSSDRVTPTPESWRILPSLHWAEFRISRDLLTHHPISKSARPIAFKSQSVRPNPSPYSESAGAARGLLRTMSKLLPFNIKTRVKNGDSAEE